jgi:sugar O-acyltransferase (sialic acid O-acetyltransferase NeuD family)
MKDLIILGTGVHAAEMAYMVERINLCQSAWNFLGHIAPGDGGTAAELAGNPILGAIKTLTEYPDAAIVADNEFPKSVDIPNDRLINLIHPSATVHPTVVMGKGCVIYPNCFIGLNAHIGDRVFALSGVTINHDDVIGDRTILASGATLAGCVTVEADCYIGQSSTIRQHLRIRQNSLIGMGAVVIKDVEANSVMAGNPARRIRSR